MSLLQLQPAALWRHFQTLCDTPRPSGHEQALRSSLIEWAQARGLSSEVDEAGNLLIRKAATPGMEDRPGVILQGHLDMVAQANADTPHNFVTDPIRTRIEDGWVHAQGTTLGADNGMGVAAALAVLESDDIAHGPLEALFTIEEESSMRGALELRPNWLQGSLLLNLDSEDRGEVYVGCAGGVDVNCQRSFAQASVPADWQGVRLSLKGLRGGHSGLDIHKGRGNANRLLVRLLLAALEQAPLRLHSFSGGTLRNALPREAFAELVLPQDAVNELQSLVAHYQQLYLAELGDVEPKLQLQLELQSSPNQALSDTASLQMLQLLDAAPHGVERMSPHFAGVVETSNNLGVVRLQQGEFSACLMVRSLRDSATLALAHRIRSLFQLGGCEVAMETPYPGWTPNPQSQLLTLFQQVHAQQFGKEADVKVIHAGLECGIIGAIYPELDMVSFGPIIRGAHSPDERVHIESVQDFWQTLVSLLAAIPAKS